MHGSELADQDVGDRDHTPFTLRVVEMYSVSPTRRLSTQTKVLSPSRVACSAA